MPKTMIKGIQFSIPIYMIHFPNISRKRLENEIGNFVNIFIEGGLITSNSTNMNKYLRGWLMRSFYKELKEGE